MADCDKRQHRRSAPMIPAGGGPPSTRYDGHPHHLFARPRPGADSAIPELLEDGGCGVEAGVARLSL